MTRLLFSLATLTATCCFAQEALVVQVKVVKGAPFSAKATTQSTKLLPDSSSVSKLTTALIARDNEGRTRREQALPSGSIIFLQDPVAGYGYLIDTNKKTVHRYTTATAADNTSGQHAGTQIGSQVIEGLQAIGTKLTHTVNPGMADDKRSFDVTIEAWYSSDLQTVLLRKTSDPRSGDTVYQLTNIDRSEPDAALFQVPAGFTIHQDAVVEK